MEDIKSLVGKHRTNETLENTNNLSSSQQPLSPRQMAISGLIQKTQTRRGLPLISAGIELRIAVSSWDDALQNVPDAQLARAYSRAADNWPWADKAFIPDAVADAYKILLVEDKQRAEADKRNAARRNTDTYRCHHCQDIGYQPLFSFRMQRWYASQRPCVCEATPIGQRNATPLEEPEYLRGKLDEWVRVVDLEKHGAPTKAFEQFIAGKE